MGTVQQSFSINLYNRLKMRDFITLPLDFEYQIIGNTLIGRVSFLKDAIQIVCKKRHEDNTWLSDIKIKEFEKRLNENIDYYEIFMYNV